MCRSVGDEVKLTVHYEYVRRRSDCAGAYLCGLFVGVDTILWVNIRRSVS